MPMFRPLPSVVARFARALVILSLGVVAAGDAGAQRPVPPPPGGGGRAMLEERFRARFESLLRERLLLSDAQMQQMKDVNQRLDGKRRELFAEERSVRREMRDVLHASGPEDQATQDKVAQLMERALRVQRARLDLVEAEQRELSAFLTPVQRARYLGLQEQLRRRADEMRRRAEGDTVDAPMPGDAPGRRPMRPFLRRPVP